MLELKIAQFFTNAALKVWADFELKVALSWSSLVKGDVNRIGPTVNAI